MICIKCGVDKPPQSFDNRPERGRRRTVCIECRRQNQREGYNRFKDTNPFAARCSKTKARAKNLGVPFDITPEYLRSIWTGKCPVFNKDLDFYSEDRNNDFAAELDRKIPELGYTKGNVAFISKKANRFKSNSTLEELKELVLWMESN